MHPYPLVLEPILKEKVWGGRRLIDLGKDLPEGMMYGESWELADLDSTSADGGGGDGAHSRVVNGEMRGLTVREVMTAMGPNLMGAVRATETGAFPLLAKFLDAREHLSVQVHPSPEYALHHAGAHLKTESWYVVDAEADGAIYRGVRAGVTPEAFRRAIENGGVEDLLVRVPVRAGDVHHLPSGTVHALGAGVLVAEVQTPSDTTFRVYDWGRSGRRLHVEEAMACIDFQPSDGTAIRSDGGDRALLVCTEYYTLSELRIGRGASRTEAMEADRPVVWMVLRGHGQIGAGDDGFAPVALRGGMTVLLPASLRGIHLHADDDVVILEADVAGGS